MPDTTAITDLPSLRASTRATLTIKETAAVLGVDARTVSRAIREGEIQTLPVGRRVLVLRVPLLARLLGEPHPSD